VATRYQHFVERISKRAFRKIREKCQTIECEVLNDVRMCPADVLKGKLRAMHLGLTSVGMEEFLGSIDETIDRKVDLDHFLGRFDVHYSKAAINQRARQDERAHIQEQAFVADLKKVGQAMCLDKNNFRQLFQRFDANDNGSINYKEFSAVLQDLNLGIDHAGRYALAEYIDTDGSKSIDFDELSSAFRIVDSDPNWKEGALQQLAQLMHEHRTQLKSLFRVLDKDGSGELDLPEFTDGMTAFTNVLSVDANKPQLSKLQIKSVFRMLDTDFSGTIDYVEFKEFLNSFEIVDVSSSATAASASAAV